MIIFVYVHSNNKKLFMKVNYILIYFILIKLFINYSRLIQLQLKTFA